MKIIRKLLIIVVCLAFFVALTGCENKETKYYVYFTSLQDDTIVNENYTLYPIWNSNKSTFKENEISKGTINITFNGKEYKGEYVETTTLRYCDCPVHVYKLFGDSGFPREEIYINSLTGEPEIFINHYADELDTKKLNQTQLRSISDELVKDYINFDKCIIEEKMDSMGDMRISYTKTLNGIKTSEEIFVEITSGGNIIQFNRKMTNRFNDTLLDDARINDKIQQLQSDSALLALDKFIDDYYAEYKKIYSYHCKGYENVVYEIIDKRLVYLDDGNLGMVYTFSTEPNIGISELLIK